MKLVAMTHTINIGDRYRRVGERWPAFRVVRLIEFEHHPDHVTLVSENTDRRSITIGTGELQDQRHWEPLE